MSTSQLIATWNVNSITVRLPHVLQWLEQHQPDILALQEIKVVDEKFPEQEFVRAGYHVAYAGQKTYNGVAIISKQPMVDCVTDIPDLDDPQRRILAATIGTLRIVNLYVPNGQQVASEKYEYKLDWLVQVTRYLQQQLATYPRLVVLGDFNIAPEDRDVHDPAAWEGDVLVSPQEREAFQKLLALGLVDSFRLFQTESGYYSWWDYRGGSFRRDRGLRIDHILISHDLTCETCQIDKEPRAWERPSDHAVVWANILDPSPARGEGK